MRDITALGLCFSAAPTLQINRIPASQKCEVLYNANVFHVDVLLVLKQIRTSLCPTIRGTKLCPQGEIA